MVRDHGDEFEARVLEEPYKLEIPLTEGQLIILRGVTLAALIQPIPALGASILELECRCFDSPTGSAKSPFVIHFKPNQIGSCLGELRAMLQIPRA